MRTGVAAISAFACFTLVGVSGVSATPMNAATSIAPAAAASSLVTQAEYVLQDGRCYWSGRNKFPRAVDMSKCTGQRHR